MQCSRVNLGGFILINQQENFKTISVLPLREVEASKFVPLWSCRGGGSGGIRGLRGGAGRRMTMIDSKWVSGY